MTGLLDVFLMKYDLRKKQTMRKKTTEKLAECYIWSDIPHKHTKNEGCINTDWTLTEQPVCLLHAILCHYITISLWYAEDRVSSEKATGYKTLNVTVVLRMI